MKVGIIGGTGPQGRGIALRWALAGREVMVGSRSQARADEVAVELNSHLPRPKITGVTNDQLVRECDTVVLTVPFEHARSTVEPLVPLLREYCQLFIDVTVPMRFEKGKGLVSVPVEEGSATQMLGHLLKPVPVVGAFKTISAHALEDLSTPLDRDTFVVGPSEARTKAIALVGEVASLRPVDGGPSREAQCVERLVPFLININRRYKVKNAGLKTTNI